LSGIGEDDPVVEAHEKLLAQELLEVLHLLADGRRGDPKFRRCGDVTSCSRSSFEGAESIEGWELPHSIGQEILMQNNILAR
jgi:hypothetical protein